MSDSTTIVSKHSLRPIILNHESHDLLAQFDVQGEHLSIVLVYYVVGDLSSEQWAKYIVWTYNHSSGGLSCGDYFDHVTSSRAETYKLAVKRFNERCLRFL